MPPKKPGYYAVKIGDQTGIYNSWEECQKHTSGYSNATFKKFSTREGAADFMSIGVNKGDTANSIYERYNSRNDASSSYRPSKSSNTSYGSSYSGSFSGRGSNYSSNGSSSSYSSNSYSKPSSNYTSGSSSSSYSPSVPYTHPSSTKIEQPAAVPVKKSNVEKHIYTDGASRGNGKSNAVAGYGVYYGAGDKRNVGVPVDGPQQTNQRAELLAIRHALTSIDEELKHSSSPAHKYKIMTDSQYSKNCFTKWGDQWSQNNWQRSGKSSADSSKSNEISHRDIIEPGYELYQKISDRYEKAGLGPLEIEYVKAHNGDPGNEAADKLANEGADKQASRNFR